MLITVKREQQCILLRLRLHYSGQFENGAKINKTGFLPLHHTGVICSKTSLLP